MLIVQAALATLLHRQYKTARTETRWHLLLKIRQMPIQTSASRGYVLFRSADKRCTKVLKLSADYEHTLWNVPNLEKHRSSGMSDAEWLEIPDFAIKIAASGCIWNAIVSFSCHKTYPVKMQSVTVPFPENKKRKRKRFLLRVGLLLLTVAVPRGIEPLFSP